MPAPSTCDREEPDHVRHRRDIPALRGRASGTWHRDRDLANPHPLNAKSAATRRDLVEVIDLAQLDDDARIVVFTPTVEDSSRV
jgi:hypothetical protein